MKWILRCLSVFIVCVSASSCFMHPKSVIPLTVFDAQYEIIALNKQAQSASIEADSSSPYMYFKFGEETLEKILELAKTDTHISLRVSLLLQNSSLPSDIALGFLYDTDFESDYTLKKTVLPARSLASGSLSSSKIGSNNLDISFAFETNDQHIAGFVLYAKQAMKLTAASFEKPFLGWSFSSSIPFFGFSSFGGSIPGSLEQAQRAGLDFSQGKKIGLNSNESYVRAFFREEPRDIGTKDNRNSVLFDFSGETYTVSRSPIQNSVSFYTSQLLETSEKLRIDQNSQMVTALMYASDETLNETKTAFLHKLKPITSDPGLIVLWDKKDWRTDDFELFSWELFPSVLIFDFKDYAVQDDFLRRLAFFVEKKGYTGKLLTDEELGNQHGFNAHDYRSESLASFFSLADEIGFPLNQKELLLRQILLENDILRLEGSSIVSGDGAVLSISQQSTISLRYVLLTHECFHGIYFTHSEFRSYNESAFRSADKNSLAFLIGYFTITPTLNYDIEDSYLLQNEFMAYLLQQPVTRVADYYIAMSKRGSVLRGLPELSEYVRLTQGQGFVDSAQGLEKFIFSRYGLTAGKVALVSRNRN